MGEKGSEAIARDLPHHLPLLVVYLAGIALSVYFFRRYRAAAVFCLLDCGLLFATNLGGMLLNAVLLDRWHVEIAPGGNLDQDRVASQMEVAMEVASGVITVLYVAADALLLAAVFVGRGPRTPCRPCARSVTTGTASGHPHRSPHWWMAPSVWPVGWKAGASVRRPGSCRV